MYSVLIVNQKTLDIFQEFYPLFIETMNAGKMGICRWLESGDTLETALPDIRDLVEDKEEWRAIIVRVEDDEPMEEYRSRPSNPFDFQYYREEKRPCQESPIPLVRLTNILGGPPAPEIHYKPEVVQEKNKAPKLVYHPVRSPEEEQVHKELREKYDYDAPEPKEIILVSVRKKQLDKDNLEQIWNHYYEMDSSEFWKVNHYASNTRFIVYDMEEKGSVRKEADLFTFWTQILLLIRNCIDPDMLQAYRLYRMDMKIDRKILTNELQGNVSRLNGATYFLDQLVETEEKRRLAKKQELPEYKIEVPVSIDFPRKQELETDNMNFSPISLSIDKDMRKWASAKRECKSRIRVAVEKAEISMDESSERVRAVCSVHPGEVEQVSRFQEKRIRADLKDLYSMIIAMQKDLPHKEKSSEEDEEEASAKVRKRLMTRITSRKILGIALVILLLAGLAALPAVVGKKMFEMGTKKALFTNLLLIVDIMVIPILVLVIAQDMDLAEKIEQFKVSLRKQLSKLTDRSNLYSEFLSAIASHSRGMSYLHIAKSGNYRKGNSYVAIERHRKAIDQMLYHLRRWNKAFYLKVSFDTEIYEDLTFDINTHPMSCEIYTLERGNSWPVALNKSGSSIDSPFEFVKEMELIREELYD